jgi:predicted 3-demethylubiquinone-9 3-methyltransferase (glyoxalase superfamily)
MSQRIVPSLWFDHTGREAVDFYLSAFPDAAELSVMRYPTQDLPDFQTDFAGDVLEIRFRLADLELSAINAGSEFRPNPSISFLANFDPSRDDAATTHLDELWASLTEGGEVRMELGAYPFSPHYGWVEDRYGVNWQLMLTNPHGDPRPVITPSLMFPFGDTRASQAADLYTGLFDAVFGDSAVGNRAPYSAMGDPDTKDLPKGMLAYSDFTLAGQWFAAMDSGVPQDFTFTEGLSLIVECDDQIQIDRLWDTLSTVPESEVCGWCKDPFGVSWQITPATMPDYAADPQAYRRMLGMKKIIIDDL